MSGSTFTTNTAAHSQTRAPSNAGQLLRGITTRSCFGPSQRRGRTNTATTVMPTPTTGMLIVQGCGSGAEDNLVWTSCRPLYLTQPLWQSHSKERFLVRPVVTFHANLLRQLCHCQSSYAHLSGAAVTVVAEGFYTRSRMPETAPGRPSLLPVIASTLGLIAVSLHQPEISTSY